MAAVLNLPALAQGHKPVAGSPFSVTCGAEAWNVIHPHQPLDDFIQRTIINYVKLFGFLILRLRLAIAADAGSGAAADL